MTANGSSSSAWRSVPCPCGRAVLLEIKGAAAIEIRRRCRRCGGWWIVDGLTYKVRGANPEHMPTPAYAPAHRDLGR